MKRAIFFQAMATLTILLSGFLYYAFMPQSTELRTDRVVTTLLVVGCIGFAELVKEFFVSVLVPELRNAFDPRSLSQVVGGVSLAVALLYSLWIGPTAGVAEAFAPPVLIVSVVGILLLCITPAHSRYRMITRNRLLRREEKLRFELQPGPRANYRIDDQPDDREAIREELARIEAERAALDRVLTS